MKNLILVLDAETTGFPSKSLDLTSPTQPHIVSLSALQYDPDAQRVEQSFSKVVIHDGWESSDEALAVHKLTAEYCSEYGRPEHEVVAELLHLWKGGELEIVGHNIAFDHLILSIGIARCTKDLDILSRWNSTRRFCTMQSSKRLVNAQTRPDKNGKTRLKNPTLAETFEHFYARPLENHHSANADTVACLQVWRALQHGEEDI